MTNATQGDDSFTDDIGAEMARLEAALERIAVLSADALGRASAAAASRDMTGDPQGGPMPVQDNSAVVAQLDGMIARLRAVVSQD